MLTEAIKNKRRDIESGTKNDCLKEDEKDVLSLLIESDQNFTDKELRSNVHLFFLLDMMQTKSNAMSYALYYLAKYPEAQERAREEVLSIFGDAPEDIIPTSEQLRRLTYINQVIKEILRVHSPVVQVVPPVAQEDTDLAGTFIPKGFSIIIDIFSIHHSKKIWKNPDEFDPERYVHRSESSQLAGKGMTWVPFGNGGRQCIAMNFSLTEQRVFLSIMLRKYKWKLPEDSTHKNGPISFGINLVSPVNLKFNLRKDISI